MRQIRDAVLSLSIYPDNPEEQKRLEFRRGLIRHCIAVGCCARQIAETAVSDIDPDLAYLAGLLHDIGKLALDEAMPKSFARIVELAEKQSACICDVERQNLGIDHTVIGKKIAIRWQLPEQIVLPIWLHHSDLSSLSAFGGPGGPQTKIVQVVQLANIIARQESAEGGGQSGNFDSDFSGQIPEGLLESLRITDTHLEQITSNLNEEFEHKAFLTDTDANQAGSHCDVIRQTAAQLAEENLFMSNENQKLQGDAGCLKFITEFLSSINPQMEAVEIAQKFALHWQRFYQLGPVCLYLMPATDQNTTTAGIADPPTAGMNSRLLLLRLPEGQSALSKSTAENLTVEPADDLEWLCEQTGVNFEQSKTKIAPVISGRRTLAVLVFELRQPVSNEQLRDILQTIIPPLAAVLDAALTAQQQTFFAELFARHRNPPPVEPKPEPQTGQPVVSKVEPPAASKIEPLVVSKVEPPVANPSAAVPNAIEKVEPAAADGKPVFDALTEMAAGAAHELNNPLLIITGRAQLFAESEQDEQKKKILGQISDNAKKISGIIDELMGFANPKPPQRKEVSTEQILESSIRLAEQKSKIPKLTGVEISIALDAAEIFVDAEQITEAVANIICNAVESYLAKSGPVKITADPADDNKYVKLTISDVGCGMDNYTLQKATLPFFSAKPAGRKRGMGLAIAKRLVELNDGSLQIVSKPAEGTTVTLLLPVP
jgi:putative nucleotidyltransferase with HDIG domain